MLIQRLTGDLITIIRLNNHRHLLGSSNWNVSSEYALYSSSSELAERFVGYNPKCPAGGEKPFLHPPQCTTQMWRLHHCFSQYKPGIPKIHFPDMFIPTVTLRFMQLRLWERTFETADSNRFSHLGSLMCGLVPTHNLGRVGNLIFNLIWNINGMIQLLLQIVRVEVNMNSMTRNWVVSRREASKL